MGMDMSDVQSRLLINFPGSVLPPPPTRYTVPMAYTAATANGMTVPIVETTNQLSNPEDGCPLQAGEGKQEKSVWRLYWVIGNKGKTKGTRRH